MSEDLQAEAILAAIKSPDVNIVFVVEDDGDVELISFCQNLNQEGVQAMLMVAYKMIHDGDHEETVN